MGSQAAPQFRLTQFETMILESELNRLLNEWFAKWSRDQENVERLNREYQKCQPLMTRPLNDGSKSIQRMTVVVDRMILAMDKLIPKLTYCKPEALPSLVHGLIKSKKLIRFRESALDNRDEAKNIRYRLFQSEPQISPRQVTVDKLSRLGRQAAKDLFRFVEQLRVIDSQTGAVTKETTVTMVPEYVLEALKMYAPVREGTNESKANHPTSDLAENPNLADPFQQVDFPPDIPIPLDEPITEVTTNRLDSPNALEPPPQMNWEDDLYG